MFTEEEIEAVKAKPGSAALIAQLVTLITGALVARVDIQGLPYIDGITRAAELCLVFGESVVDANKVAADALEATAANRAKALDYAIRSALPDHGAPGDLVAAAEQFVAYLYPVEESV